MGQHRPHRVSLDVLGLIGAKDIFRLSEGAKRDPAVDHWSHVNVGFFYGAMLADPAGLLEGSGKRMRHVKLKPDREFDAAALGDLIDAAYSDIKVRLAAESR
jgi:hypothetical protein